MKAMDRFERYKDVELDRIITYIRNGTIKSGKYSHLVKIDKNKKIKGKELFSDGHQSEQG